VIRTINRILKKNYLILSSVFAEGKTTANRRILTYKGYRFEYFTYAQVKTGNRVSYFCYDHGFKELNNNKVVLVRPDRIED